MFLGLGRIRHTVAAKIEGNEPECIRKLAFVLFTPAKVILRPSVDK